MASVAQACESLVDALIEAAPHLLVRIGEDESVARDPQAIIAIVARAEAAGVQPEGLNAWLTSHRGLAAMILLAEPDAASPLEALRYPVRAARQRRPTDERTQTVLARWLGEHARGDE